MSGQALQQLEAFLRLPETLGQPVDELAPEVRWPLLLAAVSGGADSIALLDCLDALRTRLEFRVAVVHVNHGLRGEAADQDAVFVRRLADARGLACHVVEGDARQRMSAERLSLEEAARNLRYRSFVRIANETNARAVVIAHHLDDDVETLLMRLITGSSLQGLAGMEPISSRAGIAIWRPFLRTPQAVLYQHLQQEQLPWRFDASNLETGQLRNRIRQELLPRLRTDYNPQMVRTLGKLLQELKTLRTMELPAMDVAASPVVFSHEVQEDEGPQIGSQFVPVEEWQFPVSALQGLEMRERWALWRAVLRGLGIPPKQLQRSLFEDLDTLISRIHGTLAIGLPGGLEARRTYGTLVFGSRQIDEAPPLPVRLPIASWSWTDRYPGWVILFETSYHHPEDATYTIPPSTRWWERAVFQGRITLPTDVDALEVRSRAAGDEIAIAGGGHNSLKEWFIDQKLPRLFRARWPVVALEGGPIVWVPGLPSIGPVAPESGRVGLFTAVKTAHWG